MPQRQPGPGGRWEKPTHGQAAAVGRPTGHSAGRTTLFNRASPRESSASQVRQPTTGAA